LVRQKLQVTDGTEQDQYPHEDDGIYFPPEPEEEVEFDDGRWFEGFPRYRHCRSDGELYENRDIDFDEEDLGDEDVDAMDRSVDSELRRKRIMDPNYFENEEEYPRQEWDGHDQDAYSEEYEGEEDPNGHLHRLVGNVGPEKVHLYKF
jgi:hypothetical protein